MGFRIAAGLLVLGLALAPQAALAGMNVTLDAPWDGETIPAGEVCALQGGDGMTPPMTLSGLPEGTISIAVDYNDISYPPMAFNGGHGSIGFAVSGGNAQLLPVSAMSDDLPEGVWVISPGRGRGQYASLGYMPPCSGGNGHIYQAVVKAIGADGAVLDEVRVILGRY